MERQKAILCSNHLIFINISQHKLEVEVESRKRSIYSWSGQNWADSLVDPVCKGREGWFTLFRCSFSGSRRRVVVALRMKLSFSGQEGLLVLGGDRGGLGCTKQVFGGGFKVRCTKELSDIYDFCKTQVFTV